MHAEQTALLSPPIFLLAQFSDGLLGINVGGIPDVDSNFGPFCLTVCHHYDLMVTRVYLLKGGAWKMI